MVKKCKLYFLVEKLVKIVAHEKNIVTFAISESETVDMKKLTKKENELMELFWAEGAMFVKDLLEKYDDPKPHFNTLSTMVRTLEANGYLSHKAYGNTYQYYPVVSKEEYGGTSINNMVANFFNGSYMDAVSAFVKEEKISIDELEALIEQVKKGN